jgi:hypothetical protein
VQISVRRRLSRKWGRAGVVAGVVCLVTAGAAEASCPTAETSQPFARFGDTAPYELAPQGGFETGTVGWELSGAAVTDGNESYFVGSAGDSKSLRLGSEGVATSTALCVDERYPTWRVFARKLTGAKGQLKVEMVFTDSSGKTRVAPAGKLSNGKGEYANWRPSPILKLARGLPLSKSATGMMSIRLRFTADKAGEWAVDDIYLDPYRS